MASTTFVDRQTPIMAEWLNDVNRAVYNAPTNVKNYGAVGNGVTDDTSAINTAFALLNAGTITCLYFPAGTYKVAGALTTLTRSGTALIGDGPRLSIIYQTSNTNTLTFSPTDPSSNNIGDIHVLNMGFDQQGVTAPTAGVMLTLTRVTRGYFNIDIRNVFSGILINGGNDLHFNGITLTGAYSWSSLATGSFLLKTTKHSSGNLPSEIFISDFNIKGVGTYGAALYLSTGIQIEGCDGLFLSNGHVGFTHNSSFFINPQNDSGASIQNIEVDQVYFDGNGAGNTSNSLVLIGGSTTPTVEHIKFNGCSFKNYDGNAVDASLSSLRDLRIIGCEFSNCGGFGLIMTSLQQFLISSNVFKTLNNNALVECSPIAITGASKGTVSSNLFLPGTNTYSSHVNVDATASDVLIVSNTTQTATIDFTVVPGATRILFKNNTKFGADPTVASAAPLVLPLGYDVITVSGNTNFANISAANLKGNVVTLYFTGTPTVFDGVGNVSLNGNFVATANSTLTLLNTGSGWVEVSRAIV